MQADLDTLYVLAHQLYWSFKAIDEGRVRTHRDKTLYEKLRQEIPKARLTLNQQADLRRQARREVRSGMIPKHKEKERLRQLEDDQLVKIQVAKHEDAVERSTRTLRVPGDPDVIDKLLCAKTPERIAEICRHSVTTRHIPELAKGVRIPNWPISPISILPDTLSRHAAEFIAARNDPRFPTSSRPTNRLKQLWFLSRALAGAMQGISTRTSINLIGSLRPDQTVEYSKGKRKTKTTRSKHNEH